MHPSSSSDALGVVTDNPVDNVKRPRVAVESSTVGLTTEELQRLFDAAEAHSPRLTALVYVLFFTGCRISEMLGADIRDYRTDHGHRGCASAARAARSPPSCCRRRRSAPWMR
jgi:integrase